MTPRYRAWISEADTMTNDLKGIDFENETVVLKKFYWEDGFPVEEEVFEVEIGNAIPMQSTGLKDKNGKEIFEGDILGTKDGLLNGVVEYRSDLGMLTNSLIRYNNFERLCSIAGDREIIGNIYENPELLEDNK